MVVVAMVGILSALAISGVSYFFRSAHTQDARAAIRAVGVGQEFYRGKYGQYANVSPNRDSQWYPLLVPANEIAAWKNPGHPLWSGTINPTTNEYTPGWGDMDVPLTEFHGGGCTTVAGAAGTPATVGSETIAGLKLGFVPEKDWYVVVCATDFDEDNKLAKFGGSSLFSEVIIEDDHEF